MDPVQKLKKRIAVIDKYTIGVGVLLVNLEKAGKFKFNSRDAICRNIINYFIENDTLSDKQLFVLKDRLKKYAAIAEKNNVVPIIPGQNDCKKAYLKDELIYIKTKKSPDTIEFIKSLEGRHWHGLDKVWTAKLNVRNITALEKNGFEIDDQLIAWRENILKFPNPNTININDSKLKYPIRKYQREGVAFVVSRKGRALIADQMGVGKTVQALAWIELYAKDVMPCIIVCPASLKLNWARETIKWTKNTSVYVLNGSPDKKKNYKQIYSDKYLVHSADNEQKKVIIINYDIIANKTEKYKDKLTRKEKRRSIPNTGWGDFLKRDKKIKSIVIDEAQYLKNKKTGRTKSTLSLAKKQKNIVALTGTPIVNRPSEFFTILNLLMPKLFDSFWHFAEEYCGMTHNGYGWDYSGSSNENDLHNLLVNTLMIRRTKKEVLTELPDKSFSEIPFEITNRKEYQKASENLVEWLKEQGLEDAATKAERAEALVKIEHLKQLAVEGKIKQVINWIESFIENEEKLVVFGIHQNILSKLYKHFGKFGKTKRGKSVIITGETSTKDRQKAVDDFQNNPDCLLFIGNIKAAGVGLTLTAASNVAIIEYPWTPGDLEQAEDRVHRYGQKADSVNIWYLIAIDTIENDMISLLNEKKTTLDAVIDGKKNAENLSIMSGLIEKYVI